MRLARRLPVLYHTRAGLATIFRPLPGPGTRSVSNTLREGKGLHKIYNFFNFSPFMGELKPKFAEISGGFGKVTAKKVNFLTDSPHFLL